MHVKNFLEPFNSTTHLPIKRLNNLKAFTFSIVFIFLCVCVCPFPHFMPLNNYNKLHVLRGINCRNKFGMISSQNGKYPLQTDQLTKPIRTNNM